MKTLENKNNEDIEDCPRYSLKKWEEKIFGAGAEESKNFFSITHAKRPTTLPNIVIKTKNYYER